MKFKFAAAVLIAPLLLSVPARADDKVVGQQQINADAAEAYQKADDALNAVYKKVLATKSDDAQGRQKLVEAERQWIKYRDAESESQADDYRGGSMAPMVRYQCLKSLTEARTAELQHRLDDK